MSAHWGPVMLVGLARLGGRAAMPTPKAHPLRPTGGGEQAFTTFRHQAAPPQGEGHAATVWLDAVHRHPENAASVAVHDTYVQGVHFVSFTPRPII